MKATGVAGTVCAGNGRVYSFKVKVTFICRAPYTQPRLTKVLSINE